MTSSWCLPALLLCLVSRAYTVYTTLATWDRRCFVEDVPDRTMIKYNYDVRMFDNKIDDFAQEPSQRSVLQLSIDKTKTKSDKGGVRRTQALKNGKGVVTFFAEDYGEYRFCLELHPRTTDEWEMTTARLHLSVERTYQDEERENIEDTQDNIIATMMKMQRKLKHIRMEQKYYKERENSFRNISWLTGSRVVWYGLLTALTVVSSGCFLVMNLKSFFIKKKLV